MNIDQIKKDWGRLSLDERLFVLRVDMANGNYSVAPYFSSDGKTNLSTKPHHLGFIKAVAGANRDSLGFVVDSKFKELKHYLFLEV